MRGSVRYIVPLLLLLSLGVVLWLWNAEPELRKGSIVTREGVVTDRAMSDGVPYVTVEFPDGTAVCCWQLFRDAQIPEELRIGRRVTITYGVESVRECLAFLEAAPEGVDYK